MLEDHFLEVKKAYFRLMHLHNKSYKIFIKLVHLPRTDYCLRHISAFRIRNMFNKLKGEKDA